MRTLVSILLAACLSSALLAAPPTIDVAFPTGACRGTTVIVDVGKNVDWPPQVWTSRPEVRIAPASDKGKLEFTVPVDTVPGVCWYRCVTADGATPQRPLVIGTLPEIIEADPNNDPRKPQVLERSSAVVNGRLESREDVDVYSVALQAGQTLVADLTANRLLGSPMDGVLQVLSAEGFVLAQSDDETLLDPRLVFEAPKAGRFLVRIFAFPAATDSTIGLAGGPNYVYRLTLTTGPFVDHVWPLAVSRETPASQLKVFGWNLPGGATASVLTELAATNGISLVGRDDFANQVETLTVDVPTAVEQDRTSPGEPQVLATPVCLTGRIGASGEVDIYRFTAKKGEPRLFRVESSELGYPLDPVLSIADAAGKPIVRIDDASSGRTARDIETVQTLPADGDYLVKVSDLHGRGGFRFVYRLTIDEPEAEFSASVAADAFVAQPGKPLEIPVTIERRNGFAEEVEITVEGLPAGVTAAPVKSAGEGTPQPPPMGRRGRRRGTGNAKTTTAKLVINAPAALNSPFRIVVKTADSTLVRTAPGPTAVPGTSRSDLWLTVK